MHERFELVDELTLMMARNTHEHAPVLTINW